MYVNNKIVTYFDSFGVEHVPKEIMKLIVRRKKIITNIYRIQAYDSIMCGYFCIGFINFMFNGKSLIDYTNLLPKVFWFVRCKMRELKDLTAEPVTKYRLD